MDEGEEAQAHVMKMYQFIYGNWFTMITYVYAELDIAHLLHVAPRSIAELADLTRTDAKALTRFLRCAGVMGFHTTDAETGKLAPTDLGLLLCAESPRSLRAVARLNGAPYRYQPWCHLLEYVKSGTGRGLSPTWDEGSLAYLKDKPDLLGVFEEAMTDLGKSVYRGANEDELIAASVDFTRFRRVLDVGCGNGTLLEAILLKHRRLRGALFDLKEVLDRVAPCPADHPNAGRMEKVCGDFRESVPSGYDAYLMKNVIHNGPRHMCQSLLANIRGAMLSETRDGLRAADKRLFMFEMVMPDVGEENLISNLVNLNMNLLVDGTIGARGDYEALLAESGFQLLRVGDLPGLERKVIEAAAVT
jgi:SAM-dependent methyltransferase